MTCMVKLINIIKTENIIRVTPSDTLSTALSRLTTSHDAAFVFSDEQKFMGLINPYYCLIQSSYPGNAKVEHCLFHPPKIKINYPLDKTINLIIQSKVHYLPVFDDLEKFLGIISSRHLLDALKDDARLKFTIDDVLSKKKRPLLTIYEDDPISTAISLFKQYKVSKLIVINKDLKLKGILSYYDLIYFLIMPKERLHPGEREGNKIAFYNQKVKNFAKSYVLTLNKQDQMSSALKLILDKKIGSVVIVDEGRRPVGIITTRDFLNLIIGQNIITPFEVFTKNLSKQSRQILGGFFHNLSLLPKKFPDLNKVKLFVKEEKKGGVFQVVLSLIPKRGQMKVIKKQGKNLIKLLKKIKRN